MLARALVLMHMLVKLLNDTLASSKSPANVVN
jgi:hypothetical protein